MADALTEDEIETLRRGAIGAGLLVSVSHRDSSTRGVAVRRNRWRRLHGQPRPREGREPRSLPVNERRSARAHDDK